MYDDSIRYYVRALAMNPKAENAWQYLRISLSCASRNDLLEACDSRNLDLLQKEFPLHFRFVNGTSSAIKFTVDVCFRGNL
ncbi:Tetratricopeptide-like helical domain superfamily [Sesbania bispinosa]|nr:Tetratricopeptide-like helical domain superfamily [Sesbania bispinosa]